MNSVVTMQKVCVHIFQYHLAAEKTMTARQSSYGNVNIRLALKALISFRVCHYLTDCDEYLDRCAPVVVAPVQLSR